MADIAHRHGGGGHKHAAGFTVNGDVNDAKRLMKEEVEKALKAFNSDS